MTFALLTLALAGAQVQSGPEVGSKVGPLKVAVVTGDHAGEALHLRIGELAVRGLGGDEAGPLAAGVELLEELAAFAAADAVERGGGEALVGREVDADVLHCREGFGLHHLEHLDDGVGLGLELLLVGRGHRLPGADGLRAAVLTEGLLEVGERVFRVRHEVSISRRQAGASGGGRKA